MKICAECGQEKNIPKGTKCSACIKKAQRQWNEETPKGTLPPTEQKVVDFDIIVDHCEKCGKTHYWGHTEAELQAIIDKLPNSLRHQIVTPRATFS